MPRLKLLSPKMIAVLFSGGAATVAYQIRDLFTTDLTAGNVNGTASEPTGTRNVVDTGSTVTITGSELLIDGGNNFNSAAIYLTPSQARQAGRVMIMDFRLTESNISASNLRFGWHSAANGSLSNNLGLIVNSGLEIDARRTSGGTSPAIATLTQSAQYKLFDIMRTQGQFFILKDGSTYRLLFEHEWDTSTPLYPQATSRTSDGVIYINEIATPENLFDVVPQASDSFARADGSLGNTDGAGHLEANGGDGLAWSDDEGTWAISSNTASPSALASGVAIATVDTEQADVYAKAYLNRSVGNVGMVVRYVDSNNYVWAYHNGTNAYLKKLVAGVETTVIPATAVTFVNGAPMTVICEGDQFRLLYNEVDVDEATISDAALQDSMSHGLFSSNTSNSADKIAIWKRTGWDAVDV